MMAPRDRKEEFLNKLFKNRRRGLRRRLLRSRDRFWNRLFQRPRYDGSQFLNKLFKKLGSRMLNEELANQPEVVGRESTCSWERSPEVGRKLFHHGIAPAMLGLLLDDGPAQIPVKQDQV